MQSGLKAQLRCLIVKNRNVPKIRYSGFSDEWELCKLGEYYSFKNGLNKEKEFFGKGTPIVNFTDVFHNRGIYTDKLMGKVTLSQNEIERYRVCKGDLFFTRTSETIKEIGYPSVMMDEPEDTVFSGFILRCRAETFDPLENEFKKYVFFTENFRQEMTKKSSMTTRALTSGTSLKEMYFKFPKNKEEQKKIGKFMSSIDETITLHQHQLNILKQTKQGFLQKMFPKEGELVPDLRFPGFTDDWELRNLKDYFGTIISDGDWIEKEHIHEKGEYRIIQTGNIGLGEYIDKKSSAKFMNNLSFKELKANEIFPGDILISRLADPAGRTIILPNTGNKMVTAVDVTIIRPNKNYCSYFFISEMNSKKMLYAISKNVSGTSHKRISRKNLELIILNVPSLEEQKKIGTFFKQIDDTIALQQRELDLLKETKKGFLQKLFV